MNLLTVAVCTYNRAERLPGLISALRQQECPIPFEILVVDNNSTDNTNQVLTQLAAPKEVSLRFVKEIQQGVTYARNRAIDESRNSTYLAFIDVDELPGRHWLQSIVDALDCERAECVGGGIQVRLPIAERPKWLADELLGFLGQVKYGPDPFWITEYGTPIWSGNIAYRTSLFTDGLRFDHRYNRQGKSIGGGSDHILFRTLVEEKRRIRYRPDMVVEHFVEEWRLKRSYFLKLHYMSGRKSGQWETVEYPRTVCEVPPFMVKQAVKQWIKALKMFLQKEPGTLRQAMNGTYAIGSIVGRVSRWMSLKAKT